MDCRSSQQKTIESLRTAIEIPKPTAEVSQDVVVALVRLVDHYLGTPLPNEKPSNGFDCCPWNPQTSNKLAKALLMVAIKESKKSGTIGTYIEFTKQMDVAGQPFGLCLRDAVAEGLLASGAKNYQYFNHQRTEAREEWRNTLLQYSLLTLKHPPFNIPESSLYQLEQAGFKMVNDIYCCDTNQICQSTALPRKEISRIKEGIQHRLNYVAAPGLSESSINSENVSHKRPEIKGRSTAGILRLAKLKSITGRVFLADRWEKIEDMINAPIEQILSETYETYYGLPQIAHNLGELGIATPEAWNEYMALGFAPYPRPEYCGPPAPWGKPAALTHAERMAVIMSLLVKSDHIAKYVFGISRERYLYLLKTFCLSQNPTLYLNLKKYSGIRDEKSVPENILNNYYLDFIDPIDLEQIKEKATKSDLTVYQMIRAWGFEPKMFRILRKYHHEKVSVFLSKGPYQLMRAKGVGPAVFKNFVAKLEETALAIPPAWQMAITCLEDPETSIDLEVLAHWQKIQTPRTAQSQHWALMEN